MRRSLWLVVSALAIGCGADTPTKELFDFTETISDGKAELWNEAVLVEDADPCGTVSGTIEAPWQVRGLTLEALAGETLRVEVGAWAGPGSVDRLGGEPLDTVAAIYGPMIGDLPGPLLTYADDSGGRLQATLDPVEARADGWYMVVMTVWDDPGQGRFELAVAVESCGS
jgi:hypothetical protein